MINPKWLDTGSCQGSHDLAVGLCHLFLKRFYRESWFVVKDLKV